MTFVPLFDIYAFSFLFFLTWENFNLQLNSSNGLHQSLVSDLIGVSMFYDTAQL